MTDQPKFTPGVLRHDLGTIFIDRGVQPHVAHMVDRDDAKIYGDLFAAAPDLYEALEKLRSYNEDIAAGRINYRPEDHMAVADAALAKARGK